MIEPITNAIIAVIIVSFIDAFFINPRIIPIKNREGIIKVVSPLNNELASIISTVMGIAFPFIILLKSILSAPI